jgi:hypothetical protein
MSRKARFEYSCLHLLVIPILYYVLCLARVSSRTLRREHGQGACVKRWVFHVSDVAWMTLLGSIAGKTDSGRGEAEPVIHCNDYRVTVRFISCSTSLFLKSRW